jgi:hypothetical protein
MLAAPAAMRSVGIRVKPSVLDSRAALMRPEPQLTERSRQAPYPRLSPRAPLTLAFVGQETYFSACALNAATRDVVPVFVDYRAGADPTPMVKALETVAPDVVVVFRPEIIPPGCFAELSAITVGYLTEPLPRDADAHPDLQRRLEYLRELDPSNFDRIISFDPLIVGAVEEIVPVWRSLPLPVADELFAPVGPSAQPPKALFVGRSTVHRELFLTPVKHEFDVVHLAHGASGDLLRRFLAETDIGINLHNENYPTFENRCAITLAAGQLLISEALSPTHGLEPNIDFLQVKFPDELHRMLFNATQRPDAYRRIRIRGRKKAEYFRASRVYPRLVRDLLLDIGVFGR